ncbi:hypothetical protein CKO51_12080 [Rhodopirellula sp. SM50]|nr:glycosyltransferase [Rhodopirellula sp. SM50]PAY19343.1 hypothetical protein CKO51_12080 [Rhodopirellula sp. SM50]
MKKRTDEPRGHENKRHRVLLLMPFANPHLLSIFRELHDRRQIELSFYVCRDLPQHRLALGWTTPHDARFFGWRLRILKDFISECRNSDHVVFLGVLDPKLVMFFAVLACRILGKKIWIASEGFKKSGVKFPLFVRLLLNVRSLSILAIGDRSSDDYRAAGLDRPQYYRFGFAEHYDDDSTMADGLSSRSNDFRSVRIFGVGQLNDRKNFESVVKQLCSINSVGRVEMRICGDGPNAATLRELAKQLPENVTVTLLGNCEASRLDEEFRAADLFVMPSRYDGWGVVLNQAVEYRLPCVVSSGVRAARGHLIEHGKNGFIYDSDEEMARHLETLIDDESLRNRCSEEAARIAKLWSIRSIADRLLQRFSGCSVEFGTGPLQLICRNFTDRVQTHKNQQQIADKRNARLFE